MSWWIYMIVTDAAHLYTGITTDPARRFNQHASGKGAKYFRTHSPRALVALEAADDRSSASRREAAIKRLTRSQKWDLICHSRELTQFHYHQLQLQNHGIPLGSPELEVINE